jgi:hypothetical protein
MIQNFLLYKTDIIRLLFHHLLYGKGVKTEELRIAVSVMNFSIVDKCDVKMRDPKLKF